MKIQFFFLKKINIFLEACFEVKIECKMEFGAILFNYHGRRPQEMLIRARRRSDINFGMCRNT